MLLNLLIIPSHLLLHIFGQRYDIMCRYLKAVGIFVIKDGCFFDRLSHNAFLFRVPEQ